jgi:hypothetical protein
MATGCETAFMMQIDVDRTDNVAVAIETASGRDVAEAIRSYAAENHFTCDAKEELPVRCFAQPAHILALKTPGGATVCYSALGIPTESAKYERRALDLRDFLARRFGADRVLASPMTHAWSDRCLHGASTYGRR